MLQEESSDDEIIECGKIDRRRNESVTRIVNQERKVRFLTENDSARTSFIQKFDEKISKFKPGLTEKLPPVKIPTDEVDDFVEVREQHEPKTRPRSSSQGSITIPSRIPVPWKTSTESVAKSMPTPTPPPRRKISGNLSPFFSPFRSQSNGNRPAIFDDDYMMNNKHKGKVLILNHSEFSQESGLIDRVGTEVDTNKLKRTLTKLGFQKTDIDVHDNLPLSEITKKLNELSMQKLNDMDCLMVFVLTHGDGQDKVWAQDMDYSVEKIWKPFTGDRCRDLVGKPKIFFVVACKGDKTDPGVTISQKSPKLRRPSTNHDAAPMNSSSYTIPVVADMLIIYSTFPGYYSYRESNRGTWYIEALCEEIEKLESGEEMDFVNFITKVNRKVATNYSTFNDDHNLHNKKQCPLMTSTLLRSIKFKII